MEIRPSLLSYIFADSTKWYINYEFSELTFELDGTNVKLNPEQILKTNIRKGWMWSTVTLKTLEQNYQFKGLFNAQAKKLQAEIYNDAEFLKNQRNADQIKTALLPYLFEYQDFIQQNRYLAHYLTQLFKADITQRLQAEVDRFSSLIQRDQSFAFEALQQSLFEQLKQFIEFPVKANYAIAPKPKSGLGHHVNKIYSVNNIMILVSDKEPL